MIPVERVTELLAAHAMDATVRGTGGWVGICMCGHETMTATNIRAMDQRHASHVAGVLADAGLIPGVREWGVRRHPRHFAAKVDSCLSEAEARTYCEALHLPTTANRDTKAEVVSRFTGATAWTAEEAGR